MFLLTLSYVFKTLKTSTTVFIPYIDLFFVICAINYVLDD